MNANTPSGPVVSTVPSAQGGGDTLFANLSEAVKPWSGYFEALAVLFFALALLWALLWLVKKRGSMALGPSPSMRIETRLALGPKKWIFVTRYLDRRLVIGVTDSQMSLLAEIRDCDMPDSPVTGKVDAARSNGKGPIAPDPDERLFTSLLQGSAKKSVPDSYNESADAPDPETAVARGNARRP